MPFFTENALKKSVQYVWQRVNTEVSGRSTYALYLR